MTTHHELVQAFRIYKDECNHINCVTHFFDFISLRNDLAAIEVDEEIKYDMRDEIFERWEQLLRMYGFKVLGKLNNSDEEWSGSYWIITRLTDI